MTTGTARDAACRHVTVGAAQTMRRDPNVPHGFHSGSTPRIAQNATIAQSSTSAQNARSEPHPKRLPSETNGLCSRNAQRAMIRPAKNRPPSTESAWHGGWKMTYDATGWSIPPARAMTGSPAEQPGAPDAIATNGPIPDRRFHAQQLASAKRNRRCGPPASATSCRPCGEMRHLSMACGMTPVYARIRRSVSNESANRAKLRHMHMSCAMQQIALVDLGRSGKILRNGLERDILQFNAVFLELFQVRLERAQVAREYGLAFF